MKENTIFTQYTLDLNNAVQNSVSVAVLILGYYMYTNPPESQCQNQEGLN